MLVRDLLARETPVRICRAGLSPVVSDRVTDFSCHQGRFHMAPGRWCFWSWDAEGRAAGVSGSGPESGCPGGLTLGWSEGHGEAWPVVPSLSGVL